MRKKKTAKEIVTEVIAKVEQEVSIPEVTIAPITGVVEHEDTHYFRCNVTLNNGKACNCTAFI